METLLKDIRYAVRMLLKSPAFTLVAVLSIALGIGANTLIFSAVNAALIKSLPYQEPDRIALVWGKTIQEGVLDDRNQVSWTDTIDWRNQNSVFEEITNYTGWNPIVSGDSEAERIPAIQVGDGFFKVMQGDPLLGRVFTPEEQQDGKDFVIVLSYGLWQRRFGGDPEIVGKTVQLNNRPYTIVGVMPADFHPLPSTLVSPEGQFYRPIAENYNNEDRSSRHLRAIARLKPGVTLDQAQSEMTVITKRLEQEYPTENTDYSVYVTSLTEDTVGGIRPTLLALLGAVIFVLLVACANVGNLLLARSTARQKEISIRAALGAGRLRIVRQLLTESLLLSLAGGALGLLFAVWGKSAIEMMALEIAPVLTNVDIDFRVMAFAFLLSILTGIIFGLAPALHASKTNLNEALKEGGRQANTSPGRNRLRNTLVIAEIALTLILLVCAGLLIKTVVRLSKVNTGFNPQNILTMNMGLPAAKYPRRENWVAFYNQVINRIEALPGVKSAGITSVLPLSNNFDGRGLAVEDYPKPRGEEISVDLYVTTPGYLNAMSLQLISGRLLIDQDNEKNLAVALINKTMANELWANADPIGKRIKFPGSERNPQEWRTIVGVVDDVAQYGLDKKPPMQIYLPFEQFPTMFNTLVIKADTDPKALVAAVRNEIVAVDKDQAAFNIKTMEELMSNAIALRRFFMILLVVFALVALLLASIGIYGVMSYSVSQRVHEIGIRMALGAKPGDVLKMVIGQGMSTTLVGIAVGLLGALALTRWLESLVFGVSTTDPITFVAVPLLLASVALLACALPARRATKTDPIIALRFE
jgi:putative ABC transport system permease protein